MGDRKQPTPPPSEPERTSVDNDYRFALGDRVKDSVTGFSGIVTGRADHISGCDTYAVQSEVLKDGMPQDQKWFDDPRLELVQAGVMQSFVNRVLGRDSGADGVPTATGSNPTR